MLTTEELADLAFRLDERLSADPDTLPLDLLPDVSHPVDRSQAAALMLEIAASLHDNDPVWLHQRWRDSGLDLRREDVVALLRNLFQSRINMRQPVAWSDFEEFGIPSEELQLAAPIDRAFLGQVVCGEWRLEERVASGGVAVIYRGASVQDGSAVAMKVPRRGLNQQGSAEYSDRIREEAEFIAQVAGPGVPARIAFQEVEIGPILVLEWIEATSTGIPRHLDPRTKMSIVAALARIVDRVHSKKLIHGDIKQDNVLVDHEGRTWLTDFNVAAAFSHEKRENGTRPGTLAMMSPESLQVSGAYYEGCEHDIYALGVLLYEITCDRPFVSSTRPEVVRFLAGRDLSRDDFPADVPIALARICANASTRRYALRFATAGDLAEAIEDYLNDRIDQENVVPFRPRWGAWMIGHRISSAAGCLNQARRLLERITSGASEDSEKNRLAALDDAYNGASAIRTCLELIRRNQWTGLPCADADKCSELSRHVLNRGHLDLVSLVEVVKGMLQWTSTIQTHIGIVHGHDRTTVQLMNAAVCLTQYPFDGDLRRLWPTMARRAGLAEFFAIHFEECAADAHTIDERICVLEIVDHNVRWYLRQFDR